MRHIILLLTLLLPTTVFAQKPGITPEQVASIRNVGAVAAAPDASFIAYTLVVPADPKIENRPPATHLYRIETSTGAASPLVTDGNVSAIAIRPKANTVTFLARRPGDTTTALYEVPASGGSPVKLHSHATSIASYTWAPDGNQIAYIAAEPSTRPKSGLPYEPELYEQYVPQRHLFITNVTHADHAPHHIPVPGSTYLMAWSADGSKLAASSAPTPFVDDQYMAQTIYLVTYATKSVTDTIPHAGKLGHFTFSPDGRLLAIVGAKDLNDPTDKRLLVVEARNRATSRLLFPEFEGQFEDVVWTAANQLTVLTSEGAWTGFGTIRADGTAYTRTFPLQGPVIHGLSLTPTGAAAFVASTSTHPADVYWYQPDPAPRRPARNAPTPVLAPRRLTDSNPWLTDVAMATQEVISYDARDGLRIEGILFRPVGEQPGTRYPLINVVHGGPEAHVHNGWNTNYSNPGHMAAARGYAVFHPNYRGSTGRGIDFAYSSQADMAGAEFDDVVDGVDHLIRIGLVDADRVGVTGGSYGGYATAWMSTYYSHRFAAGVMFVGISNNLSKWGTGDIPEELYHVHARKRIWDSWQEKLERSPIYHVHNSRTPLLIMHGKEDTRVHPAQSLELYRHLRVRKPDLPVQLVFYPGEGHGNRNATARYDYTLRMMDWFDTYLKP
jgi:dipeptidyl aminopeptidase/acylaminoacyl peptidase